jgi:hypothetical protein
MLRIILLLAAALFYTTESSAQTVRYYENVSSPNQDLQFDTEQCNQYGRAYAARVTPAPVQAPSGLLGQIAGGLANLGRSEMAQSYFDSAFAHCMQQLGWREVSRKEQGARLMNAEQEAREAAEREAQQQAATELEIANYRVAPPQIDSTYDEFEQRTVVLASPAHLENSHDVLYFDGGFAISTPKLPNAAQEALLIFQIASETPVIGPAPTLILLPDGRDPIRFEGEQVSYQVQTDEDGWAIERIGVSIAPAQLRELSTSALIRARLGTVEFAYPSWHMDALRTVVSRVRAPRAPAATRRH